MASRATPPSLAPRCGKRFPSTRPLYGRSCVSSAARPEGITHPSIDELLAVSGSKYQLVIYAAKRARQINGYYSQLGEGLLEYVGPLVDTHVQEKPLSIALREINEGLVTLEHFDPELPVVDEVDAS